MRLCPCRGSATILEYKTIGLLNILSSFTPLGFRVGKKWEPRNPVPGPFSAKIWKVNQNSERRREFGK